MTRSSQHHAAVRNQRARKTPAVAPITRAVRAALAMSVTMLALSAPATAAGTCGLAQVARDSHVCGATFAGHDAGLLSPVDLTRVHDGGPAPASVVATAAAAGWMGDVSRSDVGSFDHGLATASAGWDAEVVDDVTAIGNNAGAAALLQALLVDNRDDLVVSGHDRQYGIRESDFAQDLTVVNSGDIQVTSSGAGDQYSPGNHAFGIRAASVYGVDVTNTGAITARSGNDPDFGYSYARGILSLSYQGDASTSNAGSIDAIADGEDWALAFGIYNIASGLQTSTIDNSGSITATATTTGDDDYQWAWAAGARATAIYPAYGAVDGHDEVLLHNAGDIDATASVQGNGGSAVAWGAYTMSLNPGGTSTLENDGSISSFAHAGSAEFGYAYAIGALATGRDSTTLVANNGSVDVAARNDAADGLAFAIGVKAGYLRSGDGDATITNNGDVQADASGVGGRALSIGLSTGDFYSSRYGSIDNAGSVTSTASIETSGIAYATGISGRSNQGSDVINSGDVIADATIVDGAGIAMGIYASSTDSGSTTVSNLGSVSATVVLDGSDADNFGHASGIRVSGYGGAYVDNAGHVAASVVASTGDVTAYGVVSSSYHVTYLDNALDGIIDATATTDDGDALAVGALALGWDATTLTNYGDISAHASSAGNGDAQAYAAVVSGTFGGIGLLINGGDLEAVASAGAGGHAYATGAYVVANVATIFNDGNSSALATAGEGGIAIARGAQVYGEYAAVSNYGTLDATAIADGGSAMARGIDSLGYLGSKVYNVGDIAAIANADGGDATAMGSYSVGQIYSSYTTNAGTIAASATGASADALGVLNAALYLGDAITINDGSITAFAEGGIAPYGEEEAVAIGVYNFAMYYNSVVDNGGSISATAVATADISDTNGFLQAKAIGVQALAAYGYGVTAVVNSGDIHAAADTSQGYASAWGAVAQSGPYGYVAIVNDGTISSYAHTDIGVSMAVGAYALSIAGTAQLVNHGDIIAVARAERGIVDVTVDYAESVGVQVDSVPYGAGEAIVDNYGNIRASTTILGGIGYATGVKAYGQYMTLNNAAGATIIATVDAELFGGAFATAVDVGGKLGAEVVNDGTITAYGHANAYSEGENGFYGAAGANGIYVNASYQGDGLVTNNGDINAIAIAENSVSWAQGGAGATGVHVYAKYDANITNNGDINAIAQSQFGNVAAYGATIHGKYTGNIVNQAGASIVASASVGSLAGDQSAGRAVSFGTQIFGSGMDDAGTYNAGSIVSHAVVTPDGTDTWIGSIATAWGSSIGYNSGILRGEIDNVGSIEAFASADFGYATAYGAFVTTRYDATITNAGDIHAGASAIGGNAFAVGGYANAVHANVSYNCDENGCDYSNPIVDVDAGNALIDNSGDMFATASALGGTGYGYGAVALGGLTAAIDNSGRIVARTEADDALAIGALANGLYGDAQLHNSGTIVAVATGDIANATGASLTGYNGVVLDNTGTIMAGAYGADASAIAVSLESNGANLLTNTGTIAAFGDGARIAVSSATGTTGIANSGSIIGAIQVADGSLDNSVGGYWRALGASDFGADGSIVNAGMIVMDDATIALGGTGLFDNAGTLAIDGGNTAIETGLFRNDGLVSFIDGATDDVLTIAGDFAGDGAINLDVSGLNLSSDQLYIDGSVIEPTTQVLNVNLLDLPTAASVDIPLLYVSGDSLASDFSLGNVQYGADGFLTMSFGLNSSIDPTNAASDIVSLGVSVDGLNGMGSLGAALAPGAQSLVDAQIGTWRQRMGVVPRKRDGIGLAPWMRVFSGSGGMELGHHGNFGSGGTFAFDQSNHGWELGLDTRPGEHFAVGVLIAKSQGSQRLGDDAGSDRFDARSFGLYGTWLADNGFYLDASMRWTGIDARLHSATGVHDAQATADAFNIEAGFTAWTLSSGINIVPQLQYTHTRISDITPLRGSQADLVADGGVSSRARVGVAFDKSFESHGFTWTPYGSINAVHEFDGGYDYVINDALSGTTSTDGTSAMLELGLGAHKGGLSVTGGVNWTDGGAQQGVFGGQVVLRYGW